VPVDERDWDWDTSDKNMKKRLHANREDDSDVDGSEAEASEHTESMDNVVPLYDPSNAKNKPDSNNNLNEKLLGNNGKSPNKKKGIIESMFGGFGGTGGSSRNGSKQYSHVTAHEYVPPDATVNILLQQHNQIGGDNESVQNSHSLRSSFVSSASNQVSYSHSGYGGSGNVSTIATNVNPHTFQVSGYLSLKTSSFFTSAPSFARKFALLKGPYFVYYNNQNDYETKPNQPVNKRAIKFSGLVISFISLLVCYVDIRARDYTDYEVSVEVTEEYYQLTLLPTGDDAETLKSWEFRCDTQAELDKWCRAFQVAATMR
jgi:hypothetical protein